MSFGIEMFVFYVMSARLKLYDNRIIQHAVLKEHS
jgi:hypothetical protein